MSQADQLRELVDDFVIRDRRLVEYSMLSYSLHLRKENLLVPILAHPRPSTYPIAYLNASVAEQAFSSQAGILIPDADSSVAVVGFVKAPVKSLVATPVMNGTEAIGALTLASLEPLHEKDLHRIQTLSALLGYELDQPWRSGRTTRLTEELGRVLRSVREELGLSQVELAREVETSRITLSQWEAGRQPPSPGPLRRWAAALGLLAGGRPEIIQLVDVTPDLIRILRADPSRIRELTPERFEILIAERLDRMGYAVKRTGATNLRDGGIDIIAVPRISGPATFLLGVQVKHHRGPVSTGRAAIDRLLAWQNTEFRLGMLVTNTYFTHDAIWTASRQPARDFLRLRDLEDLKRWLHDVFTSEQEWREIPDSLELAPGIAIDVPKPSFREAGNVWPLAVHRSRSTGE